MREKIGTTSVEKEPEIPFDQIIAKLKSMYSVEIPAGKMGDFCEICTEIWEKKVWVGKRNQSLVIREGIQKKCRDARFLKYFGDQTISVCEVIFSSREPPDSSSAEEEGRREVRALRAESFHGGK